MYTDFLHIFRLARSRPHESPHKFLSEQSELLRSFLSKQSELFRMQSGRASERSTCPDLSLLVDLSLLQSTHRVVKSSRLLAKIAACLVSNGQLLCLAFLYGRRFLNRISLNWPHTLTSKLSDKEFEFQLQVTLNFSVCLITCE